MVSPFNGDTVRLLFDGHLAFMAVEVQSEYFAGTETQETRLLVFGIRIRLAAMP